MLTYAVLAAALVFEGASLIRAAHQIRREASGAHRRPIAHIIKSTDPALKTVASEDSIAVVGLLVAGIGVALHQVTGAVLWEGIASALIGALLVCAAVALARDNMSLLIGRSVEPELRAAIGETVSGHPKVESVVELLTRYLGADEVLVAARVELVDGLASDDIEQMSSEIDAQLRDLSAEITQVFVDATTSAERRQLEAARRNHD
jgi:divalent metal cation (Fe/Co/Zn/Cd) transporter